MRRDSISLSVIGWRKKRGGGGRKKREKTCVHFSLSFKAYNEILQGDPERVALELSASRHFDHG